MKKRLLSLIIGVMLLSLLGCNGDASTKGTGTASSQTEQRTESSSSEETVTEESSSAEETKTDESTDVATATATPLPTPDPAEGKYLKDLFAEHGMKVGTCLTGSMISRADSNELILSHFNSVTCENAMKPDSTLSQKKSKEEGKLVVEINAESVKMMEWAKKNGIAMRGHTLVWYSQTPEWIFHKDFDAKEDFVDRKEMLSRMESMIKQTFEQLEELGYIDVFYAYDVVNEAWMENGTMRDNNWKKIIGDDYLWYAFYYADKYAPETIDLYYNDYNEQFKTQTLIDFVNTLVDKKGNYLIDGVGFQAHLYTTDDLDQYFKTMDAIAETGLKIQLTELDVCLGKYQAPQKATDETLESQRKFYYDLINGIFKRVDSGAVKMDALTFWGFADSMSWRKEYSPLLFNSSLKAKPALYGALQIQ